LPALPCYVDPLHEWPGQGYYQKGFSGTSYYYINYISITAFLGISAGGLTLKTITEKTELNNEILLQEKEKINQQLHQKNEQLQQAVIEIETQNEEMVSQAEALRTNHEKLEEANAVIQHQQDELINHNEHLEELVSEKSADLIRTNAELIKYNSELRQFSYTVSHNLRGPVARLLGLTALLRLDDKALTEEQVNILRL